MEVKIFDNIAEIVRDDMETTISKGSKVSVAAACFSMYAYKELKKQLESVKEFRFIFTSPTFVTEKAEKQKREFYIPRLSREKSLYGTEFEIKLRNEMTQRAIAKECADWIKRKVKFKSNITGENMSGFMTVENHSGEIAYMPINGFTTVDIGCERGNNSYNMINRFEAPFSTSYIQLFETLWKDKKKLQDVTDVIIENITTAYNENSPEFIYFMTLYHVFSEFLDDISEDELPNEATGFKQSKIWNMLYDFQKDAALAIINKLERYNGCILADSVGLGKTFTALAVMKYYENRNKKLVNFWPDMNLDEYINLKSRVETRMKISIMTSTGDDDLINPEEKGDLEYRKQQLKRLQEEVVDIEDMSTGISIMDLGLNEFRLDLLEYVKTHPDLEQKPKGLHAVVSATEELPEGAIFVLKNINNSVNIDNQNRIHPFYMVYIGMDGEIVCDYLNPKKLLDDIRLLCRGKKQPIMKLCQKFNEETDDGRNMSEMSELLSEAIDSIIDCKEESDIDSLFTAGGTSALLSTVTGLDDFELICFLVVK